MTLKRERKYSDILDRIDYYLKQSDDWNSIDDLDDLIVAASPKFYFKDVSARTISMFNVSGEITHDYLSLLMPEGVVWDSAQEAVDTGQPFTIERNKTVEQLNHFTDELFPDETETGSDTTEAGNAIADSIVSDSSYLDYSKDDIFPTQGILLQDDNAGAIRIQRADPKDLSKGYNVYRNNASTEGGRYSQILPWSDNERTQLNDQPIHNYHNAYATAKKSMVAGGMDEGKKPRVSLGLGAKISRQQRRNLVQKVEKKLESREKAIKKGVRDRTRQRWKDNAEQFLIELPKNAQNAAGEGIRKLGEKALEAGDRLKEYEDMFTEQAGVKIREGVEKAKPEIRKALQAVRREAENQFFNAQDTWESAKQFAREKKPIIQGVLQQAKVKGSPIWNVATKKGAVLTDKAMRTAGAGLARSQAAHVAVNGFMSRMKAEFKKGHREQMERMHGAMPEGDLYENNPQGYWQERANLATKYGKANAEFDRVFWNADLMEDSDKSLAAKKEGWAKFVAVRDEVAKGAEDIGAKLENIEKHVQDIKDGSKTVLPPASGWPTLYGGEATVKMLGKNNKRAGLEAFKVATKSALRAGGVPQAPLVDPAAAAAPAAEAAVPKDEGQGFVQDKGGAQLEFNPNIIEPTAEVDPNQPYMPGLEPSESTPGEPEPGNGPVGQIPTKPGAITGASIPTEFREYAVAAPKDSGIPLHQGEERDGDISTFYDKREAEKFREQKRGDASRQIAQDPTRADRGHMEIQETNEMAAPMDDYKQAADEEEFKAKRSQSKSKIRTARANARMAKARADEAEAKASRSEAESGAKIAHMLEKLDREIIELTAYANPKVSSVLSRLEKAIDSKHKVTATKK